jgi:flagellar biosynthesis regulator FlbT
LISQYLKYDEPRLHHYPNFYTPQIEEKYKLMKHFAELIQSEYDEVNAPNKIFFDGNVPVIKTERDEEYFYTQRLHNDIIQLLDEKSDDRDDVPQPTFDDVTCTLYFQNEAIVISKKQESDPHKLMKTLFKDTNKVWANDEILEDWGYEFGEKLSEGKIYQAGKATNEKIAQSTKIKDFLDVTTKSVAINKKYLAM